MKRKPCISIAQWLGALVALIVCVGCTSARADYEQALKASVQVYCATEQRGSQQWFNVGTGVFVAQNEDAGFVLTNAHVATGDEVTIVFNERGKAKYKAERCKIIGRNNKVDVAVIKVERDKMEDGDPVCIPINPRKTLNRGQKLGTIGFPGGQETPVSYYVQYIGRNSGGLRFRPGVKNGQSGSGLFLEWNEVVGVVWGSTKTEGVAVPIELVLTTMGGQTFANVRVVGELPYNMARLSNFTPVRRALIFPRFQPFATIRSNIRISARPGTVRQVRARRPAGIGRSCPVEKRSRKTSAGRISSPRKESRSIPTQSRRRFRIRPKRRQRPRKTTSPRAGIQFRRVCAIRASISWKPGCRSWRGAKAFWTRKSIRQ